MQVLSDEEKRIVKRSEILSLLDVALNKCYTTLPAEEYDSIMSARNFLVLSNELDLERIETNKERLQCDKCLKDQLSSSSGVQHNE